MFVNQIIPDEELLSLQKMELPQTEKMRMKNVNFKQMKEALVKVLLEECF